MAASIYDNKQAQPTPEMLARDLGASQSYLDKVASLISGTYGDLKYEWKYYGQKSGWILKMLNGKRNVLFVIPCQGYFKVSLTFGDKAADEVNTSPLPEYVKQELLAAKKYAEGRSIILDVKTPEQCESILQLVRIKLAS